MYSDIDSIPTINNTGMFTGKFIKQPSTSSLYVIQSNNLAHRDESDLVISNYNHYYITIVVDLKLTGRIFSR